MQSLQEREDQDKKYNPAEQRHGVQQNSDINPEYVNKGLADLENHTNSTLDSNQNDIKEKKDKYSPADNEGSSYNDSSEPDADSQWDTNISKASNKKGRIRFTKKRGGIAGIFVTFAMISSVIGFLQSPNFIINNLREVLLGNLSELQISHNFKYRRRYMHKLSDMFTINGRRGSKLMADMESRGYKPRYDADGSLAGLELPNRRAGIPKHALEDHINDYFELRHPLRSSRWKTKQTEAFFKHYKIPRKSIVESSKKSSTEDPDTRVNQSTYEEVAKDGDDGKIKAEGESTDGKTEEEAKEIEADNETNRNIIESDGSLDEIKDELKKGKKIQELSPEHQAILRMGDNLDDELVSLLEGIDINDPKLGTKALNGIKGIFLSSEPLDRMCTLKRRTKAAIVAARLYRARDLIRYSAVFIKASDQTRVGNVDPKLMNSLMKRVATKDRNGNPIGASPGFSYAIKKRFSKNKNDAVSGGFSVAGKETGIPGAIMTVFRDTPGLSQITSDGACDVVQNVGFQIAEGAAQVALTVFSGGTSKVALEGSEQATKIAFKEAFTALVEKVFSRQSLIGIGKTIAAEISFDAAVKYIELLAEKNLSLNFTGQESGGELGNILVAGSGALNKQRSLQSGMTPATSEQYVKANREFIAWKKDRQKNQSFYTRIFDINNSDSLMYGFATTIAYGSDASNNAVVDTAKLASKSLANTLQTPSSIFSSSMRVMTQSAGAQSADELSFDTYEVEGKGTKLATDPAGNLLPILRSDIADIDPVENQESLIASGDIDSNSYQPLSEDFKEHYKHCVESVDTISILEEQDTSNVKFDCLATQEKTKKFKAHLAFLDMQDGIDSALFPETIRSGTTTSNPTVTPGTNVADAKGKDTSNQQCTIGQDGGIRNTPVENIKIRVCIIEGTDVNVAIEQNFKAILDGARAEGIDFGGSGSFRDTSEQIELRKKHCGTNQYAIYEMPSSSCSPPTARPGSSMHEWGLALDLRTGGGKLSRGSAGFSWMKSNEAIHGLKNLPSEPWHWSTTGN